jgi:hypothetical protein
MEEKPIEAKLAQFVCHFVESETARRRHIFHAQLSRAHEFCFIKEWTLSLDHRTLYDPSLVANQCPHCNLAWHTQFEKFVD